MPKTEPEMPPFPNRNADAHYVLRLYVSGATQRSLAAIENLQLICDTHLQGRYDLQVIDIYQQPELARGADIIAVPSLIKLLPLPLCQLVGDLSEKERVLVGLDLIPNPMRD